MGKCVCPHSNTLATVVVTTATAVVTAACLWYRTQKKDVEIPKELLQSPYAEELQLAVRLAHEAGQNMVGYVESKGTLNESNFDLGIETKTNVSDLCTRIDVENEALIEDGILEVYPSHAIIGEEAASRGSLPKLQPSIPTWIIDPIDGTTNFSQGIHMTCVSIALCIGGKPTVGVIYAPATNEWYLAVREHGAYRNGVRINRDRDNKKSLKEAVVCCEFGYAQQPEQINALLGALSKIMNFGFRAIRQLGSGCLDLCYVATGRLDIVYAGVATEGWKPWDYAAGLVICQESGCIMETIEQEPGEEFDLYGSSIICATSRELVDEMRALLMS